MNKKKLLRDKEFDNNFCNNKTSVLHKHIYNRRILKLKTSKFDWTPNNIWKISFRS